MTPPPILGQDDLVECLRWAAFKMCGRGEHENFASDAITMAIYLIEALRQPTQSDALREALAQIAFSGADGPYGEFGEALNEHQMRRVAKAALQEKSK